VEDDDGDLVGVFTTPPLAETARDGRSDRTAYPRLLFSRPERRVTYVERKVVLNHHWKHGWWVVSDTVCHLDDSPESEYPLAHGDPETTVWTQRFSRSMVRSVVAGRDREDEVRAAVQAELDARWPDRLPEDPDKVVVA
jgi:hypothetical protein